MYALTPKTCAAFLVPTSSRLNHAARSFGITANWYSFAEAIFRPLANNRPRANPPRDRHNRNLCIRRICFLGFGLMARGERVSAKASSGKSSQRFAPIGRRNSLLARSSTASLGFGGRLINGGATNNVTQPIVSSEHLHAHMSE